MRLIRTWSLVLAGAIVLALLPLAVTPSPALADPGTEIVIYDDDLAPGWQNWSWATVDLAATDPVAGGQRSMAAGFGPWEGLYLSAPDGVAVPLFGELRFSVHGGRGAAGPVAVQLHSGGALDAVTVNPEPGRWTDVSIPLSDLGGPGRIDGIWWQDQSGTTRSAIYVDEVTIVETATPPPVDGPSLTVDLGDRTLTRTVTDPGSDRVMSVDLDFPRPISEGIYGLNFATDALREELGITVNRWGGNSTERYNHLNHGSNTANDWYFMGGQDTVDADHAFEVANEEDGTATIFTIPMAGWVNRDAGATCAYPVNLYPNQDDAAPHYADQSLLCGNGRRDGVELGPVDPSLTSSPADETFGADWVRELVDTHGDAASGGVEMYAIGNEPNLYFSTHRDLWGEPITRTELIERNTTWAQAIKAADPTADVLGPVLWSGNSYYTTNAEMLAGLRPGDVPTFLVDYLEAMAAAEAAAGRRVLDTLTVNFYDDRVYGAGSDALRLESPRQLWDVTYAPQDWWVARDFLKGDGSAVIPRLRSLVDAHYPGTDLAITEYNFGAPDSLSGGLAQIQALGIMGREGLDIATLWEPYASWVGMTEEVFGDRPIMWGIRMYRNYDGEGSRYGDEVLYAESSDEATVPVYAARRTSDGAITVMIVNTATTGQSVPLSIPGVVGNAERFEYSGADDRAIRSLVSFEFGGAATLELPARSATLLVIDGDGDDGGAGIEMPALDAGTELIDPPVGTREGGELDADRTSYVWMESGPTVLGESVMVDRIGDGFFRGDASGGGVVPAGTEVCSFHVHVDEITDTGRTKGGLSFPEAEILGVIVRTASLRDSQALGAPATDYFVRGLERTDRLWLEGGRLTWNLALGSGIDQMRVLTTCR